jgi:hypothetical protein
MTGKTQAYDKDADFKAEISFSYQPAPRHPLELSTTENGVIDYPLSPADL